MSHQCIADAFAPATANYKAAVIRHVWGHLAANKNRAYRGFIIFANSAYDGPVLLDSEFNGLDDSPWLYDAMLGFMSDWLTGCVIREDFCRVFRFDGIVKNYEFKGTVTRLQLVDKKGGA